MRKKNPNKEKTKIAMVSSIRPATNYSAYLIEALQRCYPKRLDVLIYTSREKKNLQAPLKNIKLVWDKNILYLFQILKQTAKDRPKIVHLQHEVNMFGGLATAAIFPLLPILLKLMRVKVVTTIHAVVCQKKIDEEFIETFFRSKRGFLLLPIKLFFSLLYRMTGIFSDKIIVHTEGLKTILVRDYHLEKDKIVIMPHGVPDKVETDRTYQPSAKWFENISQRKFILTYGYLHKRKGIEVLLDAFKFLPKKLPVILVVAGGTLQKDYEQRLKRMIKELKIEKNVVFTGFVKEKDLRWFLEKCQFVLLPAQYSISASGPLAQTISQYKPVIASEIGVFSEEIKGGVDGLLAKNSPLSWAKQIERLMSDKKLSQKIVTNLRKKHQQRKWAKIAGRTNSLYQSILEK